MIPRVLFRTLPERIDPQIEAWWEDTLNLHPGWQAITYREPLPAAWFPITSPMWPLCVSGAQKAGLIRLEALWAHGGIYLDSDCIVWRSLEPLLELEAFAMAENEWHVIDAVIGASPGSDFVGRAMVLARARVAAGQNPLMSGPRAVDDAARITGATHLPTSAFAPVTAWEDRKGALLATPEKYPDSYGLHCCLNSWRG